jgi:hypothetical protein
MAKDTARTWMNRQAGYPSRSSARHLKAGTTVCIERFGGMQGRTAT